MSAGWTDIRFFAQDKHLALYFTPKTLRGIAEALENGTHWTTDVHDLLTPGVHGAIEVISVYDQRVQPPGT